MGWDQIIIAQLTDPFRIVLIIGLVYTMLRTRATTGTVLPLAAGVAFIAAMLPMTMQANSAEPLWRLFAAGLVSNGIILAVVLGLWALVQRFRG